MMDNLPIIILVVVIVIAFYFLMREDEIFEDEFAMKAFLKYLIVWISQNLSIPFWMVGHIHLMSNVYEDVIEIITSLGMNILVAIGFIIDYLDTKR